MRLQLLFPLVTLLTVGLALCGCGGGGVNDDGVKVTGSVSMGSQMQDGAQVGFVPESPEQSDTPPRGTTTKTDGTFEIKLLPGKYKVVLSRSVDKNGKVPGASENPEEDFTQLEASGALRQVYPVTYTSPGSTPISVDIPPEGKDLEPFVVGM